MDSGIRELYRIGFAPEHAMAKTLFEKIIDREIPAQIVHEDEHCVAFRDINPGAPVHILLVPRKPMPRLQDAVPEVSEVLLCTDLIPPLIIALVNASPRMLANAYSSANDNGKGDNLGCQGVVVRREHGSSGVTKEGALAELSEVLLMR